MDKASEAILALKPVTFRYKQELDPEGIPQFGLVAEEVEKVNPISWLATTKAKPYTVRYEAVNAMLLNEFLKEHQQVAELEVARCRATEGHGSHGCANQRTSIANPESECTIGAYQACAACGRRESLELIGSNTNKRLAISRPASWRGGFCLINHAPHSLKSPACSCISITASASS